MTSLIYLLLTFSNCEAQSSQKSVGFLLNERAVFLAFKQENNLWKAVDSSDGGEFKNLNCNLFFDGKTLGTVTLVDPYQECFKKLTVAETKTTKNCPDPGELSFDWSNPEPPPPPSGPCPGELGAAVDCPTGKSENIAIIRSKGLWAARVRVDNPTLLKKAFASKSARFEWGPLGSLRDKSRPLLISNQKLSDPDGWRPVEFAKIPAKIQDQILNEVLSIRKSQKCTEEGAKTRAIILTEKDLQVGRSYQNRARTQFAVPIKVKEIKGLVECNGNEMGIQSAYIIYSGGKATDLLQSMNWNYRDLELLEAADVNQDGASELYFIDYSYNSDGFAVYDFKIRSLSSNRSSSH